MHRVHHLKQFVLFFSMLAAAAFITAEKKPLFLSPHEEEIARKIGFDREVLLLFKNETQEDIHRMTGYDPDGYQIMVAGITASAPQEKAGQILLTLKPRFAKKGYMIFIVETNEGIKTDKIGILKGSDQFDILRVMQTHGADDDVSNEDVISRLKEWEKCCPFDIVGAENDWLEIEFKKMPANLKSFVEDLEDFCPEAVDEGGTSAEGDLAKEIQATSRLYLFWD